MTKRHECARLARPTLDDPYLHGDVPASGERASLSCDLVHALVPESALDQTERDRVARHKIQHAEAVRWLGHCGLTPEELQQRIADYATRWIAGGRLSDEPDQR